MGETRRAMEALSLDMDKYPRDLLQRFMASSSDVVLEEGDDSDEIELNLGLSLGGRFGVDKSSSSKKLVRSSSIAGDAAAGSPAVVEWPALMRTSSLPVETEEQWRKRKELQSLRRMAAKRRRSEKQRNCTVAGNLDGDKREIDRSLSFNLREKHRFAVAAAPFAAYGQGNVGAGGRPAESQGPSNCGEGRSAASGIRSLQERRNEETGKVNENICRTSRAEAENLFRKLDGMDKKGREIGMNAMEDMPSVFTKGDGPNGRRVDGILYKYEKGAEVRIMCICHGSFMLPADFVKHAGGGEVDHPLRRIVINPSASTFL